MQSKKGMVVYDFWFPIAARSAVIVARDYAAAVAVADTLYGVWELVAVRQARVRDMRPGAATCVAV